MNSIEMGTEINTYAFGRAVVKNIYIHNDTRELCYDVKSYSGVGMHLSEAYVNRLVSELGAARTKADIWSI